MLARFLDPLPLALLLILAALAYWTRSTKPRAHLPWLVAGWVGWATLWLAASPWFSNLWLAWVQIPSQEVTAFCKQNQKHRTLVVLAGGRRNEYPFVPGPERLDGFTQARLIGAARLYRECAFESVILTGTDTAYVQAMKELASQLGIPSSVMKLDEHARNTRENAKFAKQLSGPKVEQLVVVTSAWHARRARAFFQKEWQGTATEVVLFPVDYLNASSWKLWPTAYSLWKIYLVLHETLGMIAT
jgi:uncharacterized SAM-binding protein YcdF (DUF218 family)